MRGSAGRMAAVAVLTAGFLAAVAGLWTPASATDDYPYANRDPAELDERGFYYRQCTSFVAWRMSHRGPFDNYMNGGHWYHARNWADNAQQLGFTVDNTPAPGAIAHWYAGEAGAKELGHVAFVESVNADGTVNVEEYNGLTPLAYSRATLRAPRYIHVYDDAPAPARVAPVAAPVAPAAVRIAPAAALVSEPENLPARVNEAPRGALVSPKAGAGLHAGETVTIAGTFEDDSAVRSVQFYVSDETYRWKFVGSDEHGGNGEYSVEWTVDYAPGARVSIYAEALDDAGLRGIHSIRGIESLQVASPAQSDATVPASAESPSSSFPVALPAVLVAVLITVAIAAKRPRRTRGSLSL